MNKGGIEDLFFFNTLLRSRQSSRKPYLLEARRCLILSANTFCRRFTTIIEGNFVQILCVLYLAFVSLLLHCLFDKRTFYMTHVSYVFKNFIHYSLFRSIIYFAVKNNFFFEMFTICIFKWPALLQKGLLYNAWIYFLLFFLLYYSSVYYSCLGNCLSTLHSIKLNKCYCWIYFFLIVAFKYIILLAAVGVRT